MRKSAIYAVVMTIIGAVIIGLGFAMGENGQLSQLFTIGLVIWGGLWGLSALAGIVILFRKGLLSKTIEAMGAMAAWLGCVVLLVFGWILIPLLLLPGPYLFWYAIARKSQPQCPNPKCGRFVPAGVRVCPQCGTVIFGEQETGAEPAASEVEAIPLATDGAKAQIDPVDKEAPVESLVLETTTQISSTTVCEKCRRETSDGNLYTFFFGVLSNIQNLSRDRIREEFKVSGSESVYLCDQCIQTSLSRKGRLFAIVLAILGTLILGFGIIRIMTGNQPASDDRNAYICLGATLLALAPVILQTFRRQVKKGKLEGPGDLMAISLRKKGLQAKGYTRFWTREEMKR